MTTENTEAHEYVPLKGDVGTWCGYTPEGGMTCGLSRSAEVHRVFPNTQPPEVVAAVKRCGYCGKPTEDWVLTNGEGVACNECVDAQRGRSQEQSVDADKPSLTDRAGTLRAAQGDGVAVVAAAEEIVSHTQILKTPHPEWRKKEVETVAAIISKHLSREIR